MAHESRIKKSFLNARMNIICYSVSLLIAFFTRGIFLDNLGPDFMGLSGTLDSILGFLNLAELGIGTAIGFVLYKPIFDQDKFKINEVISVLGLLYRYIGTLILVAGIIVSFFLPRFFSNIDELPFDMKTVYIGYYCLLTSSLIGYFINYRTCILSADQRNYVVSGYYQIVNVFRTLAQVFVAIYIKSFAWYFIIQFTFGLINVIILNLKVNQLYPWLKTDLRGGIALLKKYPEVFKYTWQIFAHKLATILQYQLNPIFIYKYVSLATVALYSNYTMVTERLKGVFCMVLDSTGASIGNMVAEGDNQKTLSTFRQLFSVRALCSGIAAVSSGYLVTPFITIWLGGEYILDWKIAAIAAFIMYSNMMRLCDSFLYAHGLFYDVWAPYVEGAICITGAIIGGAHWGLPGVLLGQIISQLTIVHTWKPYFLFSKGFHKSVFIYFGELFKYLLLLAPCAMLAWLTTSQVYTFDELGQSWLNWIFGSCIFAGTIAVSYILMMCIFDRNIRNLLPKLIYFVKHRRDKADEKLAE